MHRIRVASGDITKLAVDAIVNAANKRMLGGAGVDGAIHRAAGPKLVEACRAFPELEPDVRCPTGQCRITPGFDLAAKHVIHTVGPIWSGGDRDEADLLASCYCLSMNTAVENKLTSIAFPAISCGAYGFPIPQACKIAVTTIADFLVGNESITEVILVAFEPDIFKILQSEVADAIDHN